MKKSIFVLAILLQLFGIAIWALAQEKGGNLVDEKSGIVINTDTPEETVISYFELLRKQRYEAAAALQTPVSQKSFDAANLKYRESLVKMSGASIAKVFPAQTVEDLALVGHIREVTFLGNPETNAVVGITLLKQDQGTGKWQIINDMKEIAPVEIPIFLKQMIILDNSMAKTDLAFSNLSPYQIKQVQAQIKSLQQLTQKNLDDYEELQKNAKPKENAKPK